MILPETPGSFERERRARIAGDSRSTVCLADLTSDELDSRLEHLQLVKALTDKISAMNAFLKVGKFAPGAESEYRHEVSACPESPFRFSVVTCSETFNTSVKPASGEARDSPAW